MNFGALPERLAHVRAEIARRQAAAGWTHPVTIVAVTKGFGLDAVAAARAAGLTDLGENRVQEALEKIDAPAGRGATWHLIGHLQRNKAKQVPGRFALVQSLDSLALAAELDRRAAALGVRVRVLLQVNVAGEEQKSGCPPAEAPALAQGVAALPHLALEGRKQEFRRSLRGDEPIGVEDFRVRVADELERILREKSVLEERVAALGEQLRAYRGRERAMNEALVAAQQLREATHAAAQREAQVVLREAEAEARRVLDAAGAAKADVERQAAEVQRQYQQYVGGFRALLERQLAELRALDGQHGG